MGIYLYIVRDSKNYTTNISAAYLRKNPISDGLAPIIGSFMSSEITSGSAIEEALKLDSLSNNDKKAIRQLMLCCYEYANRNGLVAILRSDLMTGLHSEARKRMFAVDLIYNLNLN